MGITNYTQFAIGATVQWTSGGVTYTGTVLATPTQLANDAPNQSGGEPFYQVQPSSPIGSDTTVLVRAVELFA